MREKTKEKNTIRLLASICLIVVILFSTGVITKLFLGLEVSMVSAHRESIMVKSFEYTMLIGGVILAAWIGLNHMKRRKRGDLRIKHRKEDK